MVVYGSKLGPNFPPDPDFFRIAVTSLIFNIFAPDFFKTNSTRAGKFENQQKPTRNQGWTLLPPSEVVVSPKSGVQNLDFTIFGSKNTYFQ